MSWHGGGGTPIFEGGRELPWDLPSFLAFCDPVDHFLPNVNLLTSFFLQKKQFVSITFSSIDKLTYRWSHFFTKICHLTILYQFSSWFSKLLTLFFIVLKSFGPSFLQSLRWNWINFFITYCTMYKINGEVPPPLGAMEIRQRITIYAACALSGKILNDWYTKRVVNK